MKNKIFKNLFLLLCMTLTSCSLNNKDQDKQTNEESYTITWKNYDGYVLEVDTNVPKGATPSYDSDLPTKESTPQYDYSFSGWDKELAPVQSDITYQAIFSNFLTHANIVFDLNGGTTSSNSSSKLANEIDAKYFFFDVFKENSNFKGWSYKDIKVFDEDGNKLFNPSLEENMIFKAIFDQTADIVVHKNIEEAGEISCLGSYQYNTYLELNATPNENYTFVGWYVNGTLISSDLNYSLLISSLVLDIEAKFKPDIFELTLDTYRSFGRVKIDSLSEYEYKKSVEIDFNSQVKISAICDFDYEFLGWFSEDNLLISEEPNYEFVMPAHDYILIAKWDSFYLSLTRENNDYGTVSGSGRYHFNDKVEITASANEGYSFVGWFDVNDELISELCTIEITIPNVDVTYKAVFIENEYSVIVESDNEVEGSVSGGGTYNYNSLVTINATPSIGFRFAGWYENDLLVSTRSDFTFRMPAHNVNCKAKFEPDDYSLYIIVQDSEKGTATGQGLYLSNSEVTVQAFPEVGYLFEGWYLGNEKISDNELYTFKMPSATTTLIAKFVENEYDLTVLSENTNYGSVTGSGTYAYKYQVQLNAYPKNGYSFSGWYLNDELISSLSSYTIEMPHENITYIAKFSANTYTIELINQNKSYGNVSGEGSYLFGNPVTLTAQPFEGYKFTGWFKNETIVSTNETFEFSMPAENISYKAKFERREYVLTIKSEDENKGTVCKSGTFLYMQEIYLSASPKNGYSFEGWYVNDILVSSNSSETITMPHENITYIAKFSTNSYNLTIDYDNEKGAVNDIAGLYEYNEKLTAVATPNEGYSFEGWYKGSNLLSNEATYTFNMPYQDMKLTAKFKTNNYKVTLNSEDENKGSVTGSSEYAYGSVVTITATEKTGYSFAGWYENDVCVSSNKSYEFIMPAKDVTYTAKFTTNEYYVSIRIEGTNEEVEIKGNGWHDYKETVEVEVSCPRGYQLIGMYIGDSLLTGTYNKTTFTMPASSVTIVAKYKKSSYKVYLENENPEKGSVSGGGTYLYESTVTLSAELIIEETSFKKSCFLGWFDGADNLLSSDLVYSFKMPYQNLWIYAKFSSEDTPKNTGDTVLFGSYPQSRVTDNEWLKDLNKEVSSLPLPLPTSYKGWKPYDWYSHAHDPEDDYKWAWYKDVTIYNQKFRAVYFVFYRPSFCGEPSNEANSNQDNNGYVSCYEESIIYWFKFEPIKWRYLVTENNESLLMSETILDCQQFQHKQHDIYNQIDGVDYEGNTDKTTQNNYKYSDLRTYLNKDFYNLAFNPAQKNKIVKAEVKNDETTSDTIESGKSLETTYDYVFALSKNDVINANYGFNNSVSAYDNARILNVSDYARCLGANGSWYLRSPCYVNGYTASIVTSFGSAGGLSYCTNTSCGLVPAIIVSV